MAVWCWGLNCCGELGPRQDCQEQGRGEKAAAEKVKKIKNGVTRPSKLCKYLILNFGTCKSAMCLWKIDTGQADMCNSKQMVVTSAGSVRPHQLCGSLTNKQLGALDSVELLKIFGKKLL